jgi:hypothetical protein
MTGVSIIATRTKSGGSWILPEVYDSVEEMLTNFSASISSASSIFTVDREPPHT